MTAQEGWSNPDGHEPMSARPRPMTVPLTTSGGYVPETTYEDDLIDLANRLREIVSDALQYEDAGEWLSALREIQKELSEI